MEKEDNTTTYKNIMLQQLKEELLEKVLGFWIDWNYEIAQGRKQGEIWLDEDDDDDEDEGICPI